MPAIFTKSKNIHVAGSRPSMAGRTLIYHITHHQELSGHVMQILLAQPKIPFKYQAGQYVEFVLPDEEPRPFSIANAPDKKVIEFHIRHFAENSYTTKLVKQIKEKQQLTIKGPYGKMRYRSKPLYPLILLAAGTGFAPCKAIIEKALQAKQHQDIYLYWGARYQSDLYWHKELVKLQGENTKFHYKPVLSGKGRVYDVALQHHADFSQCHVYASGPAEMVFASQKMLSHHGLDSRYFYSDWLEYLAKIG